MVSDIEGAIYDSDTKVVLFGNNIIKLEDLLVPDFISCNRCPKAGNCPAEEASRKAEPSHCLIEEGLVIEATKDLMHYYNITIKDKLVLFSFIINLLNLHRLSRMGARINYDLVNSEDNMDIMNKYMAMLAKIDGRYHKGLSELQATRKEQMRMQALQADSTNEFMQVMTALAKKKRKELIDGENNTNIN
jgi:hypothetical protein